MFILAMQQYQWYGEIRVGYNGLEVYMPPRIHILRCVVVFYFLHGENPTYASSRILKKGG